jgi:hypothetical protein
LLHVIISAVSVCRFLALIHGVLCIAILTACTTPQPVHSSTLQQPEQKLLINLRGQAVLPSPTGNPERGEPQGELGGRCGPDASRTELTCDIYNGLEQWNLSEVTIVAVYAPYAEENSRVYRVPISIAPLTTTRTTIKLGLQLPADTVVRSKGKIDRIGHWQWSFGAAQGHRVNR